MPLEVHNIPDAISPRNRSTPSRIAGEAGLAKVLRGLPRPEDVARVLDVGCGKGEYRFLFPGCNYLGVDLRAKWTVPSTGPGYALAQADAMALPVDDASQDLVFSAYTFQYLHPAREALREMCRVLRPGGRLVLTLPAPAIRVYELVPWLVRRLGISLGAVSAQPGIAHILPDEFFELAAREGFVRPRAVSLYGVFVMLLKLGCTSWRVLRHLGSRLNNRLRGGDAPPIPLYQGRKIHHARDEAQRRAMLEHLEAKGGRLGRAYIRMVLCAMRLDALLGNRPLFEYVAVLEKPDGRDGGA